MIDQQDPFWTLKEEDRAFIITHARHLAKHCGMEFSDAFEVVRAIGMKMAAEHRQMTLDGLEDWLRGLP